ncbi:MAG: hypothetical protein K0R22_1061 [Sporomusa sp.]|nr:hypothetical protein [Sporomusa sp.]
MDPANLTQYKAVFEGLAAGEYTIYNQHNITGKILNVQPVTVQSGGIQMEIYNTGLRI